MFSGVVFGVGEDPINIQTQSSHRNAKKAQNSQGKRALPAEDLVNVHFRKFQLVFYYITS